MSSEHGLLAGKTVLITGAARGQGRSHAIAVAREGGNVIGLDICKSIGGINIPMATEENLADTVNEVEKLGGRMVARPADVRDQAAIDEVVAEGLAEFGQIDGAVANAGIWVPGISLWDTTEDLWGTVLDINLAGTWRTIKAVAPQMMEQNSGAMVLTASINGLEPGVGYASYTAAKHAVVGLTKQAALELAPHNVRVNAIAPGAMDTGMWNHEIGFKFFGSERGRPDALEACYGFGALAGRSALPSNATSEAVVWLLSDRADQVTGTVLPVDAGHLVQPGWNEAPIKEGPVADRYRPPKDAPL